MPTEKLYWQDPFATAFEAEATRGTFGDRPSLVLDRTLFYPEAGGQLADVGTIAVGDAKLAITDVQIDDDGIVHHLADADALGAFLSSATLQVRGEIDAAHRRDSMADHTAQHMLSRALLDVARAETVSARLGASTSTIDVSVSAISDADLARAEDLVNAVVRDDARVLASFPTQGELAKMPLRRPPKVTTGIRIIEVEGFDFSPCGGTHCTKTGQIGLVRVVGTERYKGKLRVTFQAARRALESVRAKEHALSALARDLTCGPLDVGTAVAKLRSDLKSKSDALGVARGELALLVAERLLAEHPPDPSGTTPIVADRDHDDVAMLRSLASRLSARGDVVAICLGRDGSSSDAGDRPIIVQRGASISFDCGAWLKATTARLGGRGGGSKERAEGRVAATATALVLANSLGNVESGQRPDG
jgi:alanyl-tRNA synthetase